MVRVGRLYRRYSGTFLIGDATHTGNIHIGNGDGGGGVTSVASLEVENGGGGGIFIEEDYDSSGAGGDLTLTSGGAGITMRAPGAATVNITLGTGAFTANNDTTISDPVSIGGTGGITFSGTSAIDGGGTVTLECRGGGTVTVNDIGTTTPVNGVDITGATVNLEGNITTADVAGNDVSFTGSVVLGAPVTITTDTAGNDGDVTLTGASPVNGGNSFTIAAGGGSATLNNVGSGTAVNSLSVTAAAITLEGNITTADVAANNVTLNGAVTLGSDVQIDTDEAANDGAVTIGGAGTVDGGQSLTISADSADIDIDGAIGAGTQLTAVTLTGDNIELDDIGDGGGAGVSGATSVTAGTDITFTGSIYNANEQSYNGGGSINVNAGVATDFTSSGDNITFGAPMNLADGSDLSVSTGGGVAGNVVTDNIRGFTHEDVTITAGAGNVTVGIIGNADQINTVDITGSSITLNGSIQTSNLAGNTVDLNGNVLLGNAVTIDTNTAGADGAVTVTGTINNAQDLIIDAGGAAVDLQSAIGGVRPYHL